MNRFFWTFFALCIALMQGEEAKLYLQSGHSDELKSVAFSADGRWALTGSQDMTARLWDVATGREIRRLEGHTGSITSVGFSRDGRWELTGSEDDSARVWDMASGRVIRTLETSMLALEGVLAVFSADGHSALTSTRLGRVVRVWNVTTGSEVRRLQLVDPVMSAAFSPDAKLAVTADMDAIVRLWDLATGKEVRRFGKDIPADCVAFSRDGKRLVTGGSDHIARVWEVATAKLLQQFNGHTDSVLSAAFTPDGRRVLTGSSDKTARLWDATTGKEIRRVEGDTAVTAVAISPDGRQALTTGYFDEAELWDVETGEEIHRLSGQSYQVMSVTFSPDGQWALTGAQEQSARWWNIAAGREIERFQGEWVSWVHAFSPDGKLLVSSSKDNTAQIWDVATAQAVRRLEGHSAPVLAVAFSRDGRLVLTGSRDRSIRIWEAATGKMIHEMTGHSGPITCIAMSPDGRWALTGSMDNTARLWDVDSGSEVRSLKGHTEEVSAVAISPDGRWALTGSWDKTARIWELATGKEIRRLKGDAVMVQSVAFSANGRRVLIGSSEGMAQLWDAATGVEVRKLEGHSGFVSVTFSPDGRRILTAGSDGTARLWDAATLKWLATLVSFREGGWAVIDPEGRYDASDAGNAPGLHFVAGYDVIELDQLKQRFFTPGLLTRLWRGETLPAIAGSLKSVKLVPGVDVTAPPAGSMEATVRLTNRGGGLGKVIVRVNRRELAGATRGAGADRNARSAEIKVNLAGATLSPTGKNVIEVFAENGDGLIRSRALIHEWMQEPPTKTREPSLFGIVVGISSYDDARLNLRYPAKDAADFGHALELAARGLFGKERTNIRVLTSSGTREPTKPNIRAAFDWVAEHALASDLLVVYFAGHGFSVRDEHDQYYYLSAEGRQEVDRDADLRAVGTISSAELKQWLARTNMPLKQVVVLDTCAAGAAFGDMIKLADRRELSPDQIRAIELLKDSTGSWILMGSAADAVSYEATRYAQGLLTYALLAGMRGAALEGESVEVSKLFSFAQRQVEDLARGIGGIQRPVLSAPKGQAFPIGLLNEEDRRQIHLATLKPQLLRARVLDDNDLDSLKLEPTLRADLRAASLPVTRGSDRWEPRIVYLDSVVDEVPDALIPQIRYTVVADTVKVRLRLLQNGKPAVERNLELPKGEASQLSGSLLPAIVSASENLK